MQNRDTSSDQQKEQQIKLEQIIPKLNPVEFSQKIKEKIVSEEKEELNNPFSLVQFQNVAPKKYLTADNFMEKEDNAIPNEKQDPLSMEKYQRKPVNLHINTDVAQENGSRKDTKRTSILQNIDGNQKSETPLQKHANTQVKFGYQSDCIDKQTQSNQIISIQNSLIDERYHEIQTNNLVSMGNNNIPLNLNNSDISSLNLPKQNSNPISNVGQISFNTIPSNFNQSNKESGHHQYYDILFDHLSLGILIYQDGTIKYLNQYVRSQFELDDQSFNNDYTFDRIFRMENMFSRLQGMDVMSFEDDGKLRNSFFNASKRSLSRQKTHGITSIQNFDSLHFSKQFSAPPGTNFDNEIKLVQSEKRYMKDSALQSMSNSCFEILKKKKQMNVEFDNNMFKEVSRGDDHSFNILDGDDLEEIPQLQFSKSQSILDEIELIKLKYVRQKALIQNQNQNFQRHPTSHMANSQGYNATTFGVIQNPSGFYNASNSPINYMKPNLKRVSSLEYQLSNPYQSNNLSEKNSQTNNESAGSNNVPPIGASLQLISNVTQKVGKSAMHMPPSLDISHITPDKNSNYFNYASQMVVSTREISSSIRIQKKSLLLVSFFTCVIDEELQVIITFQDISAFKELRKLRFEIETNSKTLGQVAHEMRTPLNCIIGLIEASVPMINENIKKTLLTPALSSAQILSYFIHDLLDQTQDQHGQLSLVIKAFDIKTLIKDIFSLMQIQAEAKGIKLKKRIAKYVPKMLSSDPFRIRQVLINLIGNSLKFTNSGSITVTVSYQYIQNKVTKMVKISVKDTGIGIKKENLKKLFQQFGQLDDDQSMNQKGVGLGLIISNKIVVKLCDNYKPLSVHSEGEGQGSQFYFYLKNFLIENFDQDEDDSQEDHKRSDDREKTVPSDFRKIKKQVSLIDGIEEKGGMTVSATQNYIKAFETEMNLQLIEEFIEDSEDQISDLQVGDITGGNTFSRLLPMDSCDFEDSEIQERVFLKEEQEYIQDMKSRNFQQLMESQQQNSFIFSISSQEISGTQKSRYFQELKKCDCARALIVDDDYFNCYTLSYMLETLKVTNQYVLRGLAAETQVEEQLKSQCCQQYDFVFLDLEMPEQNGFQTAEQINNILQLIKTRTTKLVACSGYIDDEIKQKLDQLGFFAILDKPVEILQLEDIFNGP